MLSPLVRRSWAPKGQTPVLETRGRYREKVSVIGAVTVSPVAQRLGFYFATDPKNSIGPAGVVAFLSDLLKHLRGKVIVIWDGGGSHKGPRIREFLAKHPRLTVERLPPYCPILNPAEQVWTWLKYGKLANFAPQDVDKVHEWTLEYLIELKHNHQLLKALWNGSELPFPQRIPKQAALPADQ